MKKINMLTALLVSTAIVSPAFAADNAAKTTTAAQESAQKAPSQATKDFIKNAAIGDMFEIESSKLAQQKSDNDEVEDIAEDMIDDHSKASKELQAKVAAANIPASTIPTQLDAKHQQILNNLKSKSGAEFDKAYIEAQANAHVEAVNLYTKYSQNGDNPTLKEFAAKTLPTLKEHKQEVNEARNEIKQDRSAARAERVNNDHDDEDHDDKDHDDKH